MKITKLCLVVLHPDNPIGNYEVVKVDILDRKLKIYGNSKKTIRKSIIKICK